MKGASYKEFYCAAIPKFPAALERALKLLFTRCRLNSCSKAAAPHPAETGSCPTS